MSGIEIFGVITGATALTETLLKLYTAIKNRNDPTLPEAFHEVGKRLPLVEQILTLAKGRTDNLESEDREAKALQQALEGCKSKLFQLQEIFQNISKGNGKEKPLMDIYQKIVRKLKLDNKSGRVEALMKDVLESLQLFTMHRTFKDAMEAQAVNIAKAVEDMEKVATEAPSLPDFPEETGGANINYGEIHRQFVNWGEQTNIEGGQWNIAGAYIHGDQVLGDMNINTYNQSTYMYAERQSYYALPHNSGSHFVERMEVQEDIEAKFSRAMPGSLKSAVLVLHGRGGQGKSLIALNYCRSKNAMAQYQDVFWVDASSETTTLQGFKKIASMLSDTDKAANRGHITHDMITSVLSEWSARWLLVFDNYDPDAFNIEGYFPKSKEGNILITTRDSGLGSHGWESIEIPAMTDDEALDLFLHSRRPTIDNLSPDASSACSKLFKMLGNLPLAIDHVAQSLPGRDLTSEVHEFIQEFNERKVEVNKTMNADGQLSDQELNWHTTYECSILKLPPDIAEASVQVFTLSAFLGGTTIYGDFFQRYASVVDDKSWAWIKLLRTSEGAKRFREIVLTLSKKTLILLHKSGQTLSGSISFSLHPAIREWLRDRTKANRQDYLDQVTNMISAFCRGISDEVVPFTKQLDILVHLDTCLSSELSPGRKMEDTLVGEGRKPDMDRPIVLDYASFYRRCSRLEDAKRLQRGLLLQRRGADIPDDDPVSINFRLELGQTLRDNSEFHDAMKCYVALQEIGEKLDSIQYCQMLIGLADANGAHYRHRDARSQLDAALKLFEEGEQPMANQETAVNEKRRDEKRPESGDVHVMFPKQPWNLMRMLFQSRDYEVGSQSCSFPRLSPSQKQRHWRLRVKALIIRAMIEGNRGRQLMAHQALMKAREIGEKHCKNDNLTLEATMFLANSILLSQRQPGKAKELVDEVKKRSEEWNGPDHRMTLNTLVTLGLIWGRTGYHSDARRCFQTAKKQAKNLFGDTPGDIRNELAIGDTYAAEGNYSEAEKQYLWAKKRSDELFEPMLKRVILINLFHVYIAQLKLRDALPLTLEVLWTLPFAAILRGNKLVATLGVLVLLHIIMSSFSSGFYTAILVSGAVVVIIIWV